MPLFLLPLLGGLKSFFGALLNFCSKPPGSYVAIAAAIAIGLWWYGRHEFNKGVESVKAAQAKTAIVITERRNKITFDIDMTFQAARLKNSRATEERQREVDAHVTPQIDAEFAVPCGFVRVFQSANHGPLPDPATCPDGAPSAATLSAIGHVETENAGQYDQLAAQLNALQEWVRQQQAVKP